MKGKTGTMKYYALKESLKHDILQGIYRPGDRMPSENQLVQSFSVSRHTVRKALSILEEEGYIVAKHGKGTFCTQRALHKKESKKIAVITTYISDYIFPRVLQGMNEVLTAEGYSLIFKTTNNSRSAETQCMEDVLSKNIDGLIIEPSKSEILCRHPQLFDMLDHYEIPYVFIQGIYSEMMQKPYVLMNDFKGGYLLTNYLISLGHRDIVGIFKVDDYQGQERHRGFVKALQEAGIEYDPSKVIWFHTEDRKDRPRKLLHQVRRKHPFFSAIVSYNDEIATELLDELKIMKLRVPEDISLTGYDNSSLARFGSVKLTTIAHPQEVLGGMAAGLLLDLIRKTESQDLKKQQVIEPELIVQESCLPMKE